jgi:hypothetical protein
MSLDKKRVHHISAPISPLGIANNKPLDSLYEDYPPPAYQPPQGKYIYIYIYII